MLLVTQITENSIVFRKQSKIATINTSFILNKLNLVYV